MDKSNLQINQSVAICPVDVRLTFTAATVGSHFSGLLLQKQITASGQNKRCTNKALADNRHLTIG